MQAKKRLLIFSFIAVIILGGTGSVLWLKRYHPRYYKKIKKELKEFCHGSEEDGESSGKNCKRRTYIVNNRYRLHLSAARTHGIKYLRNDKDIRLYRSGGRLVSVRGGKGYKVQRLYYSRKVLSKRAANVLSQIGREFHKQTGSYFMVSSLTRTDYLQRRLRKRNVNATGKISSHCYGASFDISYIRFNGRKGYNSCLQNELEKVLAGFQKKHKIYVLKENRTKCYHITAR